MTSAVPKQMTVEEFYVWCEGQDERYEYVDGDIVPLRAMAGASDPHDAIVVNLIILLGNQLAGTPCRPSTADQAVRTSIRKSRRPDVTIDCSPVTPKAYEARNPIAVFEILSPTTRKNDRNVKLAEYQRHPSLRLIVHIDPDVMDVLVYKRADDGSWEHQRYEAADDVFAVTETPARLALAQIYAGVPFDAATS